jgi:hypothetical protein
MLHLCRSIFHPCKYRTSAAGDCCKRVGQLSSANVLVAYCQNRLQSNTAACFGAFAVHRLHNVLRLQTLPSVNLHGQVLNSSYGFVHTISESLLAKAEQLGFVHTITMHQQHG